jgi:GLPGLI family protein
MFVTKFLAGGSSEVQLLKNIQIMKKQLLLFAALVMALLSASAQKPDTASIVVHYKFSHQRDTANAKNVYAENMMLQVGKRSTAYKSYDARLAALDVKRQIQEQMAANGGNGPIRVNQKNGAMGGTSYYLFPDENKMIRIEREIFNRYLIAGDLPVINWQIGTDTASFGGLHCQKATTHFKGRDYTAWFCPDIPVHGGPWKLSGLPGLILEAYDTKKQVVFKFDGIEDISKMAAPEKSANDAAQPPGGMKLPGMEAADEDLRLITLPANAIKTTEPEFAKLKEAIRKDPNAFIGPTGPHMAISVKQGPRPVENNPIELPEKK